MTIFRFDFGDIVRDIVSGFTGVVMARAEYYNGTVDYGICPIDKKDLHPVDWTWLDVSRLDLVEKARLHFRID